MLYEQLKQKSRVLLGTLLLIGSLGYFLVSYLIKFKNEPRIENITVTETSATQASRESHQEIYVDISGGVVAPGIYKIPVGSRVHLLIKLAGGVSKYADAMWVAQQLNLAKELKDSDKIYIPLQTDREQNFTSGKLNLICSSDIQPHSKADSEDSYRININKATKEELIDLPGIGEVTAESILKFRPFSDLNDLYTKIKIGESTRSKIAELIEVK